MFLIPAQKHRLWVPHNLCFEQKYEKYQNFYLKLSDFGGEFFIFFFI